MGEHYRIPSLSGRYLALLDQPLPQEFLEPVTTQLPIKNEIRLNAVRFRYTENDPWVLDDLNLVITKGSKVGFFGSTGSGKSTTLDLLMGLLVPTEGQLLVDGQTVTGSELRSWQRNIAHVPQSIFLADTTLAENIAFGVPVKDIDMEKVKRAAQQAQIADFIEKVKGTKHMLESAAFVFRAANANASASPARCTSRPAYLS